MADAGQSQTTVEELRSAIRKEAIAQVAKYTIGAVVGLLTIAALGWWLYLKQQLDQYIAEKAGGIPPNSVVAFDLSDGCPKGWSAFSEAIGHTIVGSGPNYRFRVPGGNPAITLKVGNLPPHQHETMLAIAPQDIPQKSWGAGPSRQAIAGATWATLPTSLTNASLANGPTTPEPINIMPPFIALTVCKKNS